MTPHDAVLRLQEVLPDRYKTQEVSMSTTVILLNVLTTLMPLILRYCKTGHEIKIAAKQPMRFHNLLVKWRVKRALAQQSSSVILRKDLEQAIFDAANKSSEKELDELIAYYGESTHLL